MPKQEVFYRAANVTAGKALNELLKRNPGATLQEFETRIATPEEARSQRLSPGTKVFVATLRLAEEGESAPPEESSPEPSFGGEGDSADDGPPEPKAEAEPKPEKSESEDSDSGEVPKPKADGPEGGPEGESKLKPEEETNHLLKQILEAIKGPGLGGHDDLLGGPDDLGAPAPPPKPHMGPGGPGGPGAGGPPPGGPGGHGAPLPPPMDKEPPGMAFAHYDPQASAFSVIRKDANEMGLRGLRVEAESVYPTHRVARLVTTGVAEIDGYKVDLAENNIAVITLTRR